MKAILKITMVCLLAVFSITAMAQDKKKEVKTVTFSCEIDCHSCEKKIMTNIPYEKGVKDVKVDLKKQEVTVKYRTDKNSNDKLADALKDLGYKAEVKEEKIEKKK